MVIKATFSGLDGSGKSTLVDSISKDLSQNGYDVVHTLRPFYVNNLNKGVKYFAVSYKNVFDKIHELADNSNKRTAVGLINLVHHGLLSKVVEYYARSKFNPNVILAGRDPVLDPFDYSSYYFPFVNKLSPRFREKIHSMIGAHYLKPNICFYMDIDPELAHERILMRIDLEKKNGKNLKKKNWQHMHENPKDLNYLREQFEIILDILKDKDNTEIIRIDASRPLDELLLEISPKIKEKLDPSYELVFN